ncbi:hypothetical protein RFI_13691 [Reticulomyxa filosa]|uniref:Uncharacterized protein n=1 Tax=Reticulomyxa filosa TaxID=46433 RepID=X6NC64_RETFI|nr:hypothetical protein RFI_13691 [Reticulomyxa filosa]|eukprot:ETO23488.1 hypothetical protein RFI_13691 [Reticulomyxa filosa]
MKLSRLFEREKKGKANRVVKLLSNKQTNKTRTPTLNDKWNQCKQATTRSNWTIGTSVECWSNTHKHWFPAEIIGVRAHTPDGSNNQEEWLTLQWRVDNNGQSQVMSKEVGRNSIWVRYRYPDLEDELVTSFVSAVTRLRSPSKQNKATQNNNNSLQDLSVGQMMVGENEMVKSDDDDSNSSENGEMEQRTENGMDQEKEKEKEKEKQRQKQKDKDKDKEKEKLSQQQNSKGAIEQSKNRNSNENTINGKRQESEIKKSKSILSQSTAESVHSTPNERPPGSHNRAGEASQSASETSEPTPRVGTQLLQKITTLETEAQMREQQLQSEEDSTTVMLKELELKNHAIVELERKLKKSQDKMSCMKDHIKKQSQNLNLNQSNPTLESPRDFSTEISEDDRKSSHSSNKNTQKVSQKYEILQQRNKSLRKENTVLKEKLKETEIALKLKENQLSVNICAYCVYVAVKQMNDDSNSSKSQNNDPNPSEKKAASSKRLNQESEKDPDDMMSIWQVKQRKFYQQIDQLRKELESVQNQKLTLSLSNQRLQQECNTEQEVNKAIGDYAKRALTNIELLQKRVFYIQQCCTEGAIDRGTLSKHLATLKSELLLLQNNLNDITSAKSKSRSRGRFFDQSFKVPPIESGSEDVSPEVNYKEQENINKETRKNTTHLRDNDDCDEEDEHNEDGDELRNEDDDDDTEEEDCNDGTLQNSANYKTGQHGHKHYQQTSNAAPRVKKGHGNNAAALDYPVELSQKSSVSEELPRPPITKNGGSSRMLHNIVRGEPNIATSSIGTVWCVPLLNYWLVSYSEKEMRQTHSKKGKHK